MDKIPLYSCLTFALFVSTCGALHCLSCDNVAHPTECHQVVTCGFHEVCYIQYKIGPNLKKYYNLGCVDKNVCLGSQSSVFAVGKRNAINSSMLFESNAIQSQSKISRDTNDDFNLCTQCCDHDDHCNKHLCNQPPSTNLRCLSCRDEQNPKNCEHVEECGRSEFCYVHKGVNPNIGTFETRYDLGCMGSLQCNALKNVYSRSCVVCCNDTDLCNYAACDNWSPAGVSTTTKSTTTRVTTTTTTTQRPLIVKIDGPNKDHFLKETQLACVTSPVADTYTWKFNGTLSLPNGVTTHLIGGHTSNGLDILYIANLTESTFGTYTCQATYSGRTVEQTHFIGILEEKPSVHILKPPVTASFALLCKVTGYPMPRIVWSFVPNSVGSHGIPPGVQFTDQDYQSALFVAQYNPVDHAGRWYCKATNIVGSVISSVQIP